MLAQGDATAAAGRHAPQMVGCFDAHALTIQIGFGILVVIVGGRRRGQRPHRLPHEADDGRARCWRTATSAPWRSGAIPGCLLVAFCFLTAVFRPDRDPELVALLYDLGLLSYVGSLGCFTTAYFALAIAIFYDRNKIFPKWFAYVTIWQIVTEVIATPVFSSSRVRSRGTDRSASGWARVVFGVWLVCMIVFLKTRRPSSSPPTSARCRTGHAMTDDRAGDDAHVDGDRTCRATEHMWVMVLGDLIIFGCYFIIFMVYRTMKPEQFLAAQQHLNVTIGVVNTLVLLTSSWFVAQSVQAARAGDHAGRSG